MFGNQSVNLTTSAYIDNRTNATVNSTVNRSGPKHDNETFIICLVLGILVILENSLVCLAFALHQKLRKRQANILVCSQACADLFNGLVFVPIEMVERYLNQTLLTPYLIAYVLFVSLFNLFSLALDRYMALIKPLMHHLIMDVNRTKKILMLNWFLPLLITAIPICWRAGSLSTIAIASRVYVCIFWLFMFGLCVVMIAMYILVYRTAARTIRERQKRMAQLKKDTENKIKTTRTELRVAHLFGLLLFFFILAYLPILYLNLMDILGLNQMIFPIMEKLSLYSLIINSTVNPILCLLLKKDYQQIIKRWICLEWITEKWRGESMHSQASYKTVMENSELPDNGPDSIKKKRISRGQSLRRSDQKENSPRVAEANRSSFVKRKTVSIELGQNSGRKNSSGYCSNSREVAKTSAGILIKSKTKLNASLWDSDLSSERTTTSFDRSEETTNIASPDTAQNKKSGTEVQERTHPSNDKSGPTCTKPGQSTKNNNTTAQAFTIELNQGGCSFSKNAYDASDMQQLVSISDRDMLLGCREDAGQRKAELENADETTLEIKLLNN